jgi:hypothetical protein
MFIEIASELRKNNSVPKILYPSHRFLYCVLVGWLQKCRTAGMLSGMRPSALRAVPDEQQVVLWALLLLEIL